MTKVSFQGERGAYSEAAARSFFVEDIETVTKKSLLLIVFISVKLDMINVLLEMLSSFK